MYAQAPPAKGFCSTKILAVPETGVNREPQLGQLKPVRSEACVAPMRQDLSFWSVHRSAHAGTLQQVASY